EPAERKTQRDKGGRSQKAKDVCLHGMSSKRKKGTRCPLLLIPEHLTALALDHIASVPTLSYEHFVPAMYADMAEQRHPKNTGNEEVGENDRHHHRTDYCQPLNHGEVSIKVTRPDEAPR